MTEPIQMRRDSADVWSENAPVGTFDITPCSLASRPSITARIEFKCPGEKHCSVFLGTAFEDRPNAAGVPVWGWDGNEERPTLTPSINCIAEKNGKPTGACGWHGHITNGELR